MNNQRKIAIYVNSKRREETKSKLERYCKNNNYLIEGLFIGEDNLFSLANNFIRELKESEVKGLLMYSIDDLGFDNTDVIKKLILLQNLGIEVSTLKKYPRFSFIINEILKNIINVADKILIKASNSHIRIDRIKIYREKREINSKYYHMVQKGGK